MNTWEISSIQLMQGWSYFAAVIAGVYFLFFCLAINIWLKARYRFAAFQIGIALANFLYLIVGILLVLRFLQGQEQGQEQLGLGVLLYFTGSLSVCMYFHAITSFFQWDTLLSRWLPRLMIGVVVIGTTIFGLPLLFPSTNWGYILTNHLPQNLFSRALYGYYQPGLTVKLTLMLSGLVSIFGHIYFLVKILRTKSKEYLFLGGIVLTLVTVFNDNLLGGADIYWLVPLSMLGFLLECFRFNSYLFESVRREREALQMKVSELAIYSQAGHISQQLNHDVRSLIRRLFQTMKTNKGDSPEAEQIYLDTLNVLSLYSGKIQNKKNALGEEPTCQLVQVLESVVNSNKHGLVEGRIFVGIEVPFDFYLDLTYTEAVVVFDNLVRNSIKALEESQAKIKKIVIAVESEDSGYRITVCDNGVGVHRNERGILFESKKTLPGREPGLGLTIVRQVLRDRGGDIRFNEKHSMTCFEILFPHSNRTL